MTSARRSKGPPSGVRGRGRYVTRVRCNELASMRAFQENFHTRKLELGDCTRPYAAPCQHEHSCQRCPMPRVSPRQRPRLAEIIRNLAECIADARTNGWLGEVQGLHVSLTRAKDKHDALDRALERGNSTRRGGPTDPGRPVITRPQ